MKNGFNIILIYFNIVGLLLLCSAATANLIEQKFDSSRTNNDISDSLEAEPLVVCEGQIANLSCPPGRHIVIQLANFGRFSLQPCNEDNNLEISTQCQNEKTIPILKQRCENQNQCIFGVEVESFGLDPCFETPKYLEVNYKCVIKNNDFTTTTSTSTTTLTSSQTSITNYLNLVESNLNDKKFAEFMYCKTKISRQLQWPQTRRGHLARIDCPYGSEGVAEWMCSMSGDWLPFNAPDLSKCVSDWTHQFRVEINENDVDSNLKKSVSYENILQQQMKFLSHFYLLIRHENIYGGDLINLIHILSKFTNNFELLQLKQESKMGFVKLIFDSINFLLTNNVSNSWTDLDTTERHRVAYNILQINQRILSNLAVTNFTSNNEKSNLNQEIVFKGNELLAELAFTDLQEFFTLPSKNTYHNNFDSVILSKKLLQTAISTNGLANIIYTSYSKNLGKYLSAPFSDLYTSVEFDKEELNRSIISRLLSLNFINAKKNQTLNSMPLLLEFHLTTSENEITNMAKLKCVYWETVTLKWESDKCVLVMQNQTHVLCECNIQALKLKYFAVAADILTGTDNPNVQFNRVLIFLKQIIFEYGLFISCLITLFFTLCAFIYLCTFNKSKCVQIFIHKHLSFTVIICEIWLLLTTLPYYIKTFFIICNVTKYFFHFFALSAFFWIFLEVVQLRNSINSEKKVQDKKLSFFKLYSIGYGVPLIFLMFFLCITLNEKSNSLKKNIMYSLIMDFYAQFEFALIITFVVPSGIILLLTSLLLTHLLFTLCCQKFLTENSGYQRCKQHQQFQQRKKNIYYNNNGANISSSTINISSSSMIKLQRIALKSNAVIVLLFATCCFSFFICFIEIKHNHKFNDTVNIAATIFGFANSLIGLTILIGFVLLDRKVGGLYQKWLFLQNWIPPLFLLRFYRRLSSNTSETVTQNDKAHQKLFTKLGKQNKRILNIASPKSTHFDCPNSSSIVSATNSTSDYISTDVSEFLTYNDKLDSNNSYNFSNQRLYCDNNNISQCENGSKYDQQCIQSNCHHLCINKYGIYDYATIPYNSLEQQNQPYRQNTPTMLCRSLATTLSSNASNITATSTQHCPIHVKTLRVPSMYAPNNETLSSNSNGSIKNSNNKTLGLWQYQADVSQIASDVIDNQYYRSNKPPPNFPPPPPPLINSQHHCTLNCCQAHCSATQTFCYNPQSICKYHQLYCKKNHAQQQVMQIIDNIAPPSPTSSSERSATHVLRIDMSLNDPVVTERIQ